MIKIFAAGMIAVLAALAAPALATPVNAGHLQAELVSQSKAVAPGGTVWVALRQKIEPGWHTYWRNPGDSGQPTAITWTLPAGWRAGDFVWPTPVKLPVGTLMDYGYEGEVLLPMRLTAPPNARPGQSVLLAAHAQFLVCKDICVPADASLILTLPVAAGPPPADPTWGPRIIQTLSDAPRPGPLTASFTASAQAYRLGVTGAPATGAGRDKAYFYPYDPSLIDHAQPQRIERGPQGLTLVLARTLQNKGAPAAGELAGVLSLGDHAYEIDARKGAALPGAAGLGLVAGATDRSPAPGAGADLGFGVALAFAFVGGLILNLMPCVFPILAMKAAALARTAHSPRAGQVQGIAFAVGVVAAFLALAGVLLAARAAGQAVGWGFQLQSPAVLAILCLLMLLVALNLSGVFEVGAGLQGAAGAAPEKEGPVGALLTGALAVAVAAPCSAPFMASAVGFALTQSPALALGVFAALGLGMAAPFTALAFAPGLLARLPRPGPWMDGLRKVLAFPMYATAAWLLWVMSLRAGPVKLAELLAALVLAAFAAWAYGGAQRARAGGGAPVAGWSAASVAGVLAIAAALWPVGEARLTAQPYAPATLASLRAEGKPVFVNFTAAWCVTCQANDRVALSGAKVADAFRRDHVAYLVGDWTKPDADIAQALAEHGRAGVPLYLMYGAGGGEPQVLPQLLTEGAVIDAADRAARS